LEEEGVEGIVGKHMSFLQEYSQLSEFEKGSEEKGSPFRTVLIVR
jgi:hypothetical protein